ncbi:AI-2E family transporter [Massilia arenosa]|uniref:AI-2E family transporter n=1 Tax=Zemynaea arenosa TaxID=2561931 RepID=A0A4Y9SFP0_9BURK|nr:AI-2E family transporter [Massilia arenosa]TFW19750.1 AI-2E family transporter [Massilia arenosa]
MDKRTANLTRMAAVALLILGCAVVLAPFLAAVLFAAAVAVCTWPLYQRLLGHIGGRRTLAALIMSLTLTLLVIVPLALVAYNMADNVAGFYDEARKAIANGGIQPPAWLRDIPLVGEYADTYIRNLLGSREALAALAQRMLEPARHFLASGALVLGAGVAQVSLAAFVSFFLYRDGQAIGRAIGIAMERLIGRSAPDVLAIVVRTVRGVMYGLLGTALAQALVAALGFAIAGVPAVGLLASMTFVFSLIPVGPPIIWGGAALWLFNQGYTGWGIFMLVWGFFAISSVDNVVKPMLISRGSDLPFLLVLLGVLGGVLAFGFVGIFIGPTLLAVGFSLMRDWTGVEPEGPLRSPEGGQAKDKQP